MKISLTLPNGATFEFEGDESEFDRIRAFLVDPPASLTAAPKRVEIPAENVADETEIEDDDVGEEDTSTGSPLDAHNVEARLKRVGASTDMERVAVMAQAAVESDLEGLTYDEVNRLYTELGLRKPPKFPKTFSNAKNAGLIRSVKYGLWRPTTRGENFARGHGRERDLRRGSPLRQQFALDAGGETD